MEYLQTYAMYSKFACDAFNHIFKTGIIRTILGGPLFSRMCRACVAVPLPYS